MVGSKPTATTNIGQEKGFYTLPDDPSFPDDDPEIIEDQLATFENRFVESMDVAVRLADSGDSVTLDDRAHLAKTVAFQHLRTRAWRDRTGEVYRSACEQVLNTALAMASELSGQKRPNFKAVVPAEEARAWGLQADAMWTGDTINKLAARIYHSVWIVALNRSNRPFLTSDSPVAVQEVVLRESSISAETNPFERIIEVRGAAVPGALGTQAFLPLTPRHALMMLDPTTFPESVERQGQVLCIGTKTVDQINSAQVLNSQRWVYASSKDFSNAVPLPDNAGRPITTRRIDLPL